MYSHVILVVTLVFLSLSPYHRTRDDQNRVDVLEMYANHAREWRDSRQAKFKELRMEIKYGEAHAMAGFLKPPALRGKSSTGARSTKAKQLEKMMSMEKQLAKRNFLIRIVHRVMGDVAKYTTHCLMCGNALKFPGAKPAICDKKTCVFQFNALGLGVDIGSALETQGDLLKLLMGCFYSATQPQGKQICTSSLFVRLSRRSLTNWSVGQPYDATRAQGKSKPI